MTDLPKYHVGTQQADALLAPIDASLRTLERRVQHYIDRVSLAAPDRDALTRAHTMLADASHAITQLLEDSRQREVGSRQ